MKKNKKMAAVALATLAAGFIMSGAVHANDAATEGKVKCSGINSCKGTSACKSEANECHGKNGCKGKGWTWTKSEKECTDAHGTVVKK